MNSKGRHINKIFETEWFTVDAIFSPLVNNKPYYRFSLHDSVSIFAKTIDGKIILIRQYRPAIESFIIELPSGYVDKGEFPEDAIKRELEEETGFICDSVNFLGSLKTVPSRINNTLHVFFGKDAKLSGTKITEDKDIELILIAQDEFKKLIVEGKYIETAGIAIFLLAQLKGYL